MAMVTLILQANWARGRTRLTFQTNPARSFTIMLEACIIFPLNQSDFDFKQNSYLLCELVFDETV